MSISSTTIPKIGAAPDAADADVRNAALAAQQRALQGSRRRSFLTSGDGSSASAGSQIGTKSLLGT